MGPVVERLRSVFIRQFAVRGGAGIIGKAIPFGIGAAIGGIGNNVLGRRVLAQSRLAFGGPPMILPLDLEPRERDPLLQVTGVRMSRAGTAVGGAVGSAAIATTRGIQAAGRAAGRAARGAITRKKGDARARGVNRRARRHGHRRAADAQRRAARHPIRMSRTAPPAPGADSAGSGRRRRAIRRVRTRAARAARSSRGRARLRACRRRGAPGGDR